jgi:hypothetical protein
MRLLLSLCRFDFVTVKGALLSADPEGMDRGSC